MLSDNTRTPMLDDPLDDLIHLARHEGWPCKREGENELTMTIKAGWGAYEVNFVWYEAVEALSIAVMMADTDLRHVSDANIAELLRGLNERMWTGHFDIFAEDGRPCYRDTLLLAGTEGATPHQLDALIDHAIEECERMHPAFMSVARRGVAVDAALSHAMLETMGEA